MPNGLGYIDPSRVQSYYDSKGKEIVKDSGSLQAKVIVGFKGERHSAGDFYLCREITDSDSRIIYSGWIRESDLVPGRINPSYVVEDNRGIIIPITRERILEEIKKGMDLVEKGYRENFQKPEKLAEVAGFDFKEEISNAKTHSEERYIQRYSSEENLKAVLDSLDEFGEYGYGLQFDGEMGEDPHEETLGEFFDNLPRINFPNDSFRERTVDFLNHYEKEASEMLQHRQTELEKKIEEELGFFRSKRDRVKLLLNNLESKS